MHHDAGVVLALGKAQHLDAHQRRHYDFVAYHRGERDARDDNHAGRSREAAQESEQGQPGMFALHGHGQVGFVQGESFADERETGGRHHRLGRGQVVDKTVGAELLELDRADSLRPIVAVDDERLAREFDEMASADSTLPLGERLGYTAVLAMRDWRFSVFDRFQRT